MSAPRRFFIELESTTSFLVTPDILSPVPDPRPKSPFKKHPHHTTYPTSDQQDLARFLGTEPTPDSLEPAVTTTDPPASKPPPTSRVRRDINGFPEGSAFFDPSLVVTDDSSTKHTDLDPPPHGKNSIFDLHPSTWMVAPCPPILPRSQSEGHASTLVVNKNSIFDLDASYMSHSASKLNEPDHSSNPRPVDPPSNGHDPPRRKSIFDDPPSPVLPAISARPPPAIVVRKSSSPSKHLLPEGRNQSSSSPVLVPLVINEPRDQSATHHVPKSLWTNPSANRRLRSISLTQDTPLLEPSAQRRRSNSREFQHLCKITEAPAAAAPLADWTVIDPTTFMLHYVPLRKNLLGEGLHAAVYRGTYVGNAGGQERPCAVKVLNPDSEESQTTGLLEAALLKLCQHPNIVRAIELVDVANHPWDVDRNGPIPDAWTRLTLANLSYPPMPHLMECSLVWTQTGWRLKSGSGSPVSSPEQSPLSLLPSEHMTAENSPTQPPYPKLAKSPTYVLVLELCEGGSLWTYTRKYPNTIGRRRWMRWARQLTQAIVMMHSKRIVHHDIKPQNILLDEFLGIKLSDLGGSEVVPSEGYFPATVGKGTLAFMAPELVHQQSYNSSIDMYALGLTLFVVGILGHEPYMGCTSPVQLLMAVSRGFWNWPTNLPEPHRHSRIADSVEDPDTRGVNPGSVLRKGVPHPHAPNRLIRFLNGDLVDFGIWRMLTRCLDADCEVRPTAVELLDELRHLDGLEVEAGEL